jgi:uncharacterized membrane protein YdfJ with MMPL/SSD domain
MRYSKALLALMIVVAGVAAVYAQDAPSHLSNKVSDFISHESESFDTAVELDEILPKGSPGPPDLAAIARGEELARKVALKMRRLPQIMRVGKLLFPSRDGKQYAAIAWLKPKLPPVAASRQVARSIDRPGVLVGGTALATYEFSEQVSDDLHRAELIAVPLLIVLGFVIFRSVVSALLPVVVGGFAAACALALLRVATNYFPISVFSLNLVIGLALGLGVDYSLLMVSRFREELSNGRPPVEAGRITLRSAGKTVGFSSAAIAASAASLLVFPIPFIRSMAFGGILVALIAGAAALLFLPPLLSLLGPRVNALAPAAWQRRNEDLATRHEGGWYRLARFVMRRPLLVALCSALLLLALGLPSLSMRFTGFDASSLPAGSNTRIFAEEAIDNFRHPVIGEIEVAIHGPFKAANPLAARVESLATRTRLADVFPSGFEHSPRLWQMNLNPTAPAYSGKTIGFVKRLRQMDEAVQVTGESAAYTDTAATLNKYLPRALAILVAGTFLFLFLATRSLLLPIKALIMNALSLSAAFGLLVFVFQGGRLESALAYSSQDALVLALPIVLAAGAFGLLTDYGLFLLMRIKETREAGASNREAIAIGLEKTGRTVTAAATMFAAAVGSFATSGVVLIKEGAIGIAVAVLIDAFVVRPLLVPSLMALLGRWNWWPGRLSRRGT